MLDGIYLRMRNHFNVRFWHIAFLSSQFSFVPVHVFFHIEYLFNKENLFHIDQKQVIDDYFDHCSFLKAKFIVGRGIKIIAAVCLHSIIQFFFLSNDNITRTYKYEIIIQKRTNEKKNNNQIYLSKKMIFILGNLNESFHPRMMH